MGAFQQRYEYWVPATFDTSTSIRCRIPTTFYSGGNGILDFTKVRIFPNPSHSPSHHSPNPNPIIRFTKELHLSTSNDGVTSRYTNTTFLFDGDCLPAPIVLWISTFLLVVAVLLIACAVCLNRKETGPSEEGEQQKEWLQRVMREVCGRWPRRRELTHPSANTGLS